MPIQRFEAWHPENGTIPPARGCATKGRPKQ